MCFIFLKVREEGAKKEGSFITGLLPKYPQWLVLNMAKPEIKSFFQLSAVWSGNQALTATLCCLLKQISMELN